MEFVVRVRKVGAEDKLESFEDKHNEKLEELSDKANAAYIKAVGEYDVSHVITIFRDGVSLQNALGHGSGALKLEKDKDVVANESTAPGQGGPVKK